jgi:hypothetical protein
MDEGFVEGDEEGWRNFAGMSDDWEIMAGEKAIERDEEGCCSKVVGCRHFVI